MAQQAEGKKKGRTEKSGQQAAKAPPKPDRELPEEDLEKLAGGIVVTKDTSVTKDGLTN
jgi:hypothetical protein